MCVSTSMHDCMCLYLCVQEIMSLLRGVMTKCVCCLAESVSLVCVCFYDLFYRFIVLEGDEPQKLQAALRLQGCDVVM